MRSMDILPLNVSLGCTYLCIHNPLDGATVTQQRPLIDVGELIMVLVARIDLVREENPVSVEMCTRERLGVTREEEAVKIGRDKC